MDRSNRGTLRSLLQATGPLLALWVAGAACATMRHTNSESLYPDVTLKNLSLASTDTINGIINVAVGIRNPNPFSIITQRVTYSLFADTILIGSGRFTRALRVPAADSMLLTFDVTFTYAGLGPSGRKLIGAGPVSYHLTGELAVQSAAGISSRPLSLTGKYSIFPR